MDHSMHVNQGDQKGGLIAVRGLVKSDIDQLCRDYHLDIAIINAFDRFIIGGNEENLSLCMKALVEKSIKFTALKMTIASHTSLMNFALPPFEQELKNSSFKNPQSPVLSGLTGQRIFDKEQAIKTLTEQLNHTIHWDLVMESLIESGCTIFLELGPGHSLSRLLRDYHPSIEVRSTSDFHSFDGLINWLQKHLT
jgi:[acyl-carrier-protein] S-malonyltransferase